MKLHLSSYDVSVSTPSDVNVGLQSVGFSGCCSEELYIDFIVISGMSFIIGEL